VFWLAARPGFDLHVIWYLSVASLLVHATANVLLVRAQIRRQELTAVA
jgi:hypothetical protein